MKKIIFLLLILTGIVFAQSKEEIINNLRRGGNIDVTTASPDSSYHVLVWNDLQGEVRLVTVQNLGGSGAFDTVSANYGIFSDSLQISSGATFSGHNVFTGTNQFDTLITLTTQGKGIAFGSYASKIALTTGATTEMVTIAGEGSEDDFYIGYGSYVRSTGEDGKPFGLAVLVEGTNTTGTATMQGGQIMAFLGSVGGTEAAHLKTAVGDATAGMYALWLKIGANPNAVFDAGSKASVLWIDDQLSGTISGENYGIYATTGGGVPDAFIGFETSSSGWSQLLYFDETAYNKQPVSGTALKVLLNTTQYYLPLSTSGTSFDFDTIGTSIFKGTNTFTGANAFTNTVTLSGTMGNGINATGTFTDHIIDIQPAASLGDYKAIYIGTWGTEAQFNDGGGLFRIYGKVGSGGVASANIFVRTLTESTSPPIGMQIYTDTDASTPGSAGMSAIDAFTVVNAGKYLATSSGSWLNSMHSIWAKVQSDVTSVVNGSVAPIWVDNQMSSAVAEEEYGIIMTTGGSRPDGAFGFETTSSGYDQLFYFDETFNSGAGTMITTDAVPGTQDARIKVYYNATQYYIALYR